MTFDQLLREFGLPLAALTVLVVTGARRWWVWGWQYAEKVAECERMRTERDQWKDVALDALHVGRKLVSS